VIFTSLQKLIFLAVWVAKHVPNSYFCLFKTLERKKTAFEMVFEYFEILGCVQGKYKENQEKPYIKVFFRDFMFFYRFQLR